LTHSFHAGFCIAREMGMNVVILEDMCIGYVLFQGNIPSFSSLTRNEPDPA
jgi:hypothetical protein